MSPANDYLLPTIHRLENFEPFEYRKQKFGKRIEFDNVKHQIKAESDFHDPDYISYPQIEKMEIIYDPKKWLYWVGIFRDGGCCEEF